LTCSKEPIKQCKGEHKHNVRWLEGEDGRMWLAERGDASASAGLAERWNGEVDDVLQGCGDVLQGMGKGETCMHRTWRIGSETAGGGLLEP
jgi:hypothetical protein